MCFYVLICLGNEGKWEQKWGKEREKWDETMEGEEIKEWRYGEKYKSEKLQWKTEL